MLKSKSYPKKTIPIEFDKRYVKVQGHSEFNNADVLLPRKCVVCIFQVLLSSMPFFSRHFSYLRVKYGFPHKQERKVQPKNKKKTKTVKPTNQNATLLWLDPILCAKNLCKEGASAQIELLLLYTTTSQYLCQTAVPPIHKTLNLEECKQPS